ncbi:MAG: 50S ribosomal protein L30e [Candidatus Hodarchaeota archaeon]
MPIEINNAIKVAVQSGKVKFGIKAALKAARTKNAKMIIIAKNCPKKLEEKIIRRIKDTNILTYTYEGSSWELGTACLRPHIVETLTIIDPGSSDILKISEEI